MANFLTHAGPRAAVPPTLASKPKIDLVDPSTIESRPLQTRIVTFPTARLRGPGVTVTTAAAAAISLAMQRNVTATRESPLAGLYSNIVLFLPDADFMGVNSLGYGAISLHSELDDVRERALAISDDLRRVRVQV